MNYTKSSVCPFQVENLLDDLEVEVIKNIEKNYGESQSLTSLWNATMEEVRYFFLK